MARPQKAGLDYFPFDVGLLKDTKMRRPKMKFGYLATQVYIALLALLYGEKGYYIPYETQREKDDCIWYILDTMQGKFVPDTNTIAEVIEELVACELFSGDRYPKNITSKRSQTVYYSATVDRKSVVIEDTIWLLSMDEMSLLSAKHFYYLSKLPRPNNGVNQPNNGVNQPNNPQRKEEERKEKKSKEEKIKGVIVDLGIIVDESLKHSAEEYDKALKEWNKSNYAKSNFCHLSKIHKFWDKLISGFYADYKKPQNEDKPSAKTYTTEELNARFDDLDYDDV